MLAYFSDLTDALQESEGGSTIVPCWRSASRTTDRYDKRDGMVYGPLDALTRSERLSDHSQGVIHESLASHASFIYAAGTGAVFARARGDPVFGGLPSD